jgi:hypothetical protein
LFGLVVTLLSRFAIVAQLDLAFLPLFLVDGDARGAGFEEGHRQGEADGLALVIDGLEDRSLELTILEGGRAGQNIVRGFPRACAEGMVCEFPIALAEPRLDAFLEVMLLDGH